MQLGFFGTFLFGLITAMSGYFSFPFLTVEQSIHLYQNNTNSPWFYYFIWWSLFNRTASLQQHLFCFYNKRPIRFFHFELTKNLLPVFAAFLRVEKVIQHFLKLECFGCFSWETTLDIWHFPSKQRSTVCSKNESSLSFQLFQIPVS